jgi:hypothetical protein
MDDCTELKGRFEGEDAAIGWMLLDPRGERVFTFGRQEGSGRGCVRDQPPPAAFRVLLSPRRRDAPRSPLPRERIVVPAVGCVARSVFSNRSSLFESPSTLCGWRAAFFGWRSGLFEWRSSPFDRGSSLFD